MLRTSSFRLAILVGLSAFVNLAGAQSIQYDAGRKVFLLNTAHSSYAMGVGTSGQLQHLYWGGRLWRTADVPPAQEEKDISSFDPREMLQNEEYAGAGGKRFYEPALKITRQDGDRDLVLRYKTHKISTDQLDVTLTDINDPVTAILHYRVYADTGIISRWTTIENGTKEPLTVESAQSATWYVPHGDGYRLSYLSGRWAAEIQVNQEPVHEGIKVLDSKLGHTGHNFNPWFALDHGTADEEARRGMVRSFGLERELAHRRRTDAVSPGACDRRV